MLRLSLVLFIIFLNNFGYSHHKTIHLNSEQKIFELILKILNESHLNVQKIDDQFSRSLFADYLKEIDPNKIYLFESDYQEFKKFETKLDDQIKVNDLSFFYLTKERILMRMKTSYDVYKILFKNPFTFTENEVFELNSNLYKYSKNDIDAKNRFKSEIKYNTIRNLWKIYQTDQAKKEKDINYITQEFNILEHEAREKSFKMYDASFDNYNNLARDYFFELYINSVISQFDPHSQYVSAKNKEKFEINLTGKKKNVGLAFRYNNNFIEIKEVFKNSLAWKSKKIDVGDFVLKFAEGNNEPKDVVGMKFYELIKLLEGKTGTIFKLTLKKIDGTIIVVALKREDIDVNNILVKSCIVEKKDAKFGVIIIPSFYESFNDGNERNAAQDLAKEIEQLKKENITGIVLDLRNNDGSSIDIALQIYGMFVDNNPFVQLQSVNKKLTVLKTVSNSVLWNDNLTVLVNFNTAAAAEVLAAAIQDANRGLVIGTKQTFGKSTLQNNIDLNTQIDDKTNNEDLGILRLTSQKCYRLTGNSVQLKGVESQIVLPNILSNNVTLEKNQNHVLASDKIDSIFYIKTNPDNYFETTIFKSRKRIAENYYFKILNEQATLRAERLKKNIEELNFNKFKSIKIKENQENIKFDVLKQFKNNLVFKSTQLETEFIKKNDFLKTEREKLHQHLSQDFYVDEALNVLLDLQSK